MTNWERSTIKNTFSPEQKQAWKPKIIERNTFSFTRGKDKVIRLHKTDIVTFKPNGKMVLNSGGWRTKTTMARISNELKDNNYGIWADKGIWYVCDYIKQRTVAYYDNMVLPDCFMDKNAAKSLRARIKEEKLRKDIKKFVNLITPDNLPISNAGDCWLCSLRDAKSITLGQHTTDTNHLLEHIKEGYMHGSLIMNALKWAGYNTPQYILQLRLIPQIKRTVKRYLYSQLGLVI